MTAASWQERRNERQAADQARKHEPPRVYGFDPAKCGTYAGYARHQRSDVPPCEPCKTALADYMNNYRAQRKVAA